MQQHLRAWMPWLGPQDAQKVLGFSDFPSDFVRCWGEYGHSNICIYKSKRGGWKQTAFPNLLSQSDTKSDAESWVDEDVVNQFKPEGKSPLWKFRWLLEAFWEVCTNLPKNRNHSTNQAFWVALFTLFMIQAQEPFVHLANLRKGNFDDCKIFVGGLNLNTSVDQLMNTFAGYGQITDAAPWQLHRSFGWWFVVSS